MLSNQRHCHVLLHTHLLAPALPPANTKFLVPTCQYQCGCKMRCFCFATDLQQLCMALSGKADTYHLAAILVLILACQQTQCCMAAQFLLSIRCLVFVRPAATMLLQVLQGSSYHSTGLLQLLLPWTVHSHILLQQHACTFCREGRVQSRVSLLRTC